jgi:copper transport protein
LRRSRPALLAQLGLLGLLATWLLLPTPALAHASVVSLYPAQGSVLADLPAAIRIRFSEPVSPFGRGIDVYAPDGRRVSATATTSGAALLTRLGDLPKPPQGTYLVEWRIVAQDTHPSRGSYTFSVGHPGPAPSGEVPAGDFGAVAPLGLALQAVARWLHFLGFALSFGVLAFLVLVLREHQPPPRLRRLAYVGIGLLIVAEPIALVAQAASLGTIDSPSLADVLGSAFGRVLALRLAAALVLWVILGAPADALRSGISTVLVLGVGLAGVDGLSGHTIRGLPLAAGALLTAVHEASMVVWVGGLVALLAMVGDAPDRRALVERFGRVAAISVGVLILSGGVLALVHLRSPADLLFSAYGLTLAIKSLAVAVALGLAWTGLRTLRSGRPELLTLAGVLALAALLASLPPPR